MNILYPASEIALNIIPHELQKRGFKVTRMSAYETNEAQWGEDLKKLAKKVDIVTLTSPSAARAWVAKTGSDYDAIVIGPTTFKAAKSLGFHSVTCVPNKTGCLQGMVESIKELLLLKY